ncbi:MAG: HpcH/HpaI aldolase/citrate lyase family protein, partial [Methylococcales bacterium]
SVIANLVTTFRPYGFELTAPVFEYLDEGALLCEELRQDLAFGLFGKTAIHPSQVGVIEDFYRVSRKDVDVAQSLLHPNSNAVFRMHNSMCEVATHSNWAIETMRRAQIFGIVSG